MAAPVTALEVGTSKVVALVGEMREHGSVMVTGIGTHQSHGVRKGEIVDFENAVVCAKAAIAQAEHTSGENVSEIHIVVSGGYIRGTVNTGRVPVLGEDGEIGEDEIEKVMDLASAHTLGSDRDVLHSLPQHYCIDDQELVIRPEGMVGAQLALDVLLIHGLRSRIQNTINVAKSLGMKVVDVAFSGLCSALSVLTPEQKKAGAVVIDFGAGTTDYIVYAGDAVAAAGALGVGGDHVTNDIVIGFNIPRQQAEALKCKYGSALVDEGDDKRVSLPAEAGFPGRKVSVRDLDTVINARCDEIFSMIRKLIEHEGALHKTGAGVVLTGGGSRLNGVRDLVENVFHLPCVIGRPRGLSGLPTVTQGSEFATCTGMIQYGFRTAGDADDRASLGDWIKGLFG